MSFEAVIQSKLSLPIIEGFLISLAERYGVEKGGGSASVYFAKSVKEEGLSGGLKAYLQICNQTALDFLEKRQKTINRKNEVLSTAAFTLFWAPAEALLTIAYPQSVNTLRGVRDKAAEPVEWSDNGEY